MICSYAHPHACLTIPFWKEGLVHCIFTANVRAFFYFTFFSVSLFHLYFWSWSAENVTCDFEGRFWWWLLDFRCVNSVIFAERQANGWVFSTWRTWLCGYIIKNIVLELKLGIITSCIVLFNKNLKPWFLFVCNQRMILALQLF